MPKPINQVSIATSALILLAGISAVGLLVPRHFSFLLALAYFSAFFGYFWFCQYTEDFRLSLALGSLGRLLLFFGMPMLSDDIYRFLWDGYLLASGISPFSNLPDYYLTPENQIPGLTQQLYQNLNSPHYFSVYPPLNQLIFWISVQFGDSWLVSTNLIRSLLLLADIGSFLVLRKLLIKKQLKPSLANWYFLNPLVILEFTGNLHFEGMVVFFLLLGLYFIVTHKPALSGVGFGLAVTTKLLPLIYLPALLMHQKLRKGAMICGVAMTVALVSLLPMLDEKFVSGIQSSLSLYINKFEFNGSVYFLARAIGYSVVGYNAIWILGPLLSFLTVILIGALAIYAQRSHWPLEKTLLFTLTIYLLLATTVHPWYILPLIALGLLSGFYFPIVWSLMIFVTYFGYTQAEYELSGWWIVFEYIVVSAAIILELTILPKIHEEVI